MCSYISGHVCIRPKHKTGPMLWVLVSALVGVKYALTPLLGPLLHTDSGNTGACLYCTKIFAFGVRLQRRVCGYALPTALIWCINLNQPLAHPNFSLKLKSNLNPQTDLALTVMRIIILMLSVALNLKPIVDLISTPIIGQTLISALPLS